MVNLTKGESISLTKKDGSSLTKITLGLEWDSVAVSRKFFGGSQEIDLDASAILLDPFGAVVDKVWYGGLKNKNRSVIHTGDNLTGAGDGDDEQIIVNLPEVPPNVSSIVFVITSYRGQKFDKVRNVFARVIDQSGVEVARYKLDDDGAGFTAKIVASVKRAGTAWEFKAIGANANGRTVKDLTKIVSQYV